MKQGQWDILAIQGHLAWLRGYLTGMRDKSKTLDPADAKPLFETLEKAEKRTDKALLGDDGNE